MCCAAVATPPILRCAWLTYCWIQPLKLLSQTSRLLSNKWITSLFTWVFLHCFAVGEALCQPLFLWWGGSASPRLCMLEIPMLLRAREMQALGLCWLSLIWPGWGTVIPGPRQLWDFRLIHPLSKRVFCMCMYVMWCFIIVYAQKVGFFSLTSMASCRLYDISVALQELKNVAYFPKNPSSESCCSHGNRNMTAFQRLSLYCAAVF